MILTIALLVLGLALLVAGGEVLVRGASGLGRALGLSPLIIGLTVVAFATSAPELAVSIDATTSGAAGLAVGNVVGSNITNILLVLGLAALVTPVVAGSQLVRIDVPVMIGLAALLLALTLDGSVSRVDAVLLLAVLVVYLGWSIRAARQNGSRSPDPEPGAGSSSDPPPARRRPLLDVVLVIAGVALLVAGARFLVDAATEIAEAAGLSDLVIGLTVVAIGTSLPEVATSIIAAARGEREMAIGNVVGSNIFNVGAVMGITALVAPDGVPVDAAAIRFDLPVMVVVAVALLPVVFTGAVIARWEGALFLAYYSAYVAYLLLAAADHDALPTYSATLLWFAIPLTVTTLVVLSGREIRARRASPPRPTSSAH